MALSIPIIIGSSSIGSHGRTPAQWMLGKVQSIPGVTSEIIDLWEYPLQFYQGSAMEFSLNNDFDHSLITKWHDKIEAADVIIVMSPARNPGYADALRKSLTRLSAGWTNKPQCMINYGSETDPVLIDQISLVAIHLKLSGQNGTSNQLWNLMLNI